MKVFVALDYPAAEPAWETFQQLKDINPYFKVGLELFSSAGPEFVAKLAHSGAKVFLDLKFHDIPNTVAGAVRAATRLQVGWTNIHCGGGVTMMKAALEAAHSESAKLGIQAPKILGVTVLTSLNDAEISAIGFPRSASAQVKHFVDLALESKLDGVVCSAHELPLVRNIAGKDFLTMVPGIRPAGADLGDQQRVMTPSDASKAGADCIVVGRPITQAANPRKALEEILAGL